MEVPYILEVGHNGVCHYKLLRPTGRWKIESGPYYERKMFIEHKGVLFKQWIPEASIEFKPREESYIFECN